MNIYKHELKMKLRSVFIWSVWLAFMIFAFTSLFTTVGADAELFNEMMTQFPEELLMAFGMVGLDMSTILGYYGFMFLFC